MIVIFCIDDIFRVAEGPSGGAEGTGAHMGCETRLRVVAMWWAGCRVRVGVFFRLKGTRRRHARAAARRGRCHGRTRHGQLSLSRDSADARTARAFVGNGQCWGNAERCAVPASSSDATG